ncbi:MULTISPECIES: hypothetical protein [Shewanella]|uniref:hypothetical protein n=1 Tax=Shewanella TaxID=22 RepID=UPI0012F6F9BB|nr:MULTISPECIES: hypothetical protein [Shewanella]MDH1628357.1 hypothetical protein [Shewanella xiamenensis]MDV5248848.1 hypothetical protein [Shewanella xiamenensis]
MDLFVGMLVRFMPLILIIALLLVIRFVILKPDYDAFKAYKEKMKNEKTWWDFTDE